MWEYHTEYIGTGGPLREMSKVVRGKKYAEFMEQMGQGGWELVTVLPNGYVGRTWGAAFVFKRPVAPMQASPRGS